MNSLTVINVQVLYVNQDDQFIVNVDVPEKATVEQAIKQSGVLEKFPEISLDVNEVGIYGETVAVTTVLKQGDRVEVYRPLTINPMEARRLRAKA